MTGGTDNHLLLLNVHATFGLTGRQAETALFQGVLTVNRNTIPGDLQGPWYTSGIRLGTGAITTLGMKEEEMDEIAECITKLLRATHAKAHRAHVDIDRRICEEIQQRNKMLLQRFVLYPELYIE